MSHTENISLGPVEKLSLTLGLEQVRRGEAPSPNIATMCVLTLARITGTYDYRPDEKETNI